VQVFPVTAAFLATLWLPATSGGEPSTPSQATQEAADSDGETPEPVIDGILPCGLRVLVARDLSLPVAAVVLAVETGSEDDPEPRPGLAHALAYHLMQGNRELAPGEALATAHDGGGLVALSTGTSQIRFESVVPLSRLDAMLWAESQRLRSPTITASAWQKSLSWAGADRPQPMPMPREVVAAVHGDPNLVRDGRKVNNALRTASLDEISRTLRNNFTYARSTLIVVGPEPPKQVFDRIGPLFANLPERARSVPARRVAAASTQDNAPTEPASGPVSGPSSAPAEPSSAPAEPSKTSASGAPPAAGADTPEIPPAFANIRVVELKRGRGLALAWPVDPNPQSALVAEVICKAINQQRRAAGESRKTRVRCGHHRDARRGVLLIHATGTETPLATLVRRLGRLHSDKESRLLTRHAEAIRLATEIDGQTPLGRARLLAATAPATQMRAEQNQVYTQFVGLDLLANPEALRTSIRQMVDPARAIALIKGQPKQPPAPTTGPAPATDARPAAGDQP